MLLSGPSYRFGVLGLGSAFGLLGIAAKAGIAAIVIAVVGLVLALIARRGRYAGYAVLGIVFGVLAFVPPMMFKQKAQSVPPIHDISTDTVNLPTFQTLLPERKAASNGAGYGGVKVANQQHAAYPDIQPMTFDNMPQNTFHAALAVAKSMGWRIAAQDVAQGRIEATATTTWFGFKDDVVIRTQAVAGGTRVDIRSDSRVGQSDVGANAARIRAFREKLSATLGHDRRSLSTH